MFGALHYFKVLAAGLLNALDDQRYKRREESSREGVRHRKLTL